MVSFKMAELYIFGISGDRLYTLPWMVGAPVVHWWSTKYAASHVRHFVGWQVDGASVS